MIFREEIDEMAQRYDLSPANVQRDYIHGWLLWGIFSKSKLAGKLTLKGGNSLRKGYFENFRYSSDLDFSSEWAIHIEELETEFHSICEVIQEKSGVVFALDKNIVREKRQIDEEKKLFEVKLYFINFYGKKSQVNIKVKVDITEFDRLILPAQQRPLLHPYSDRNECVTSIMCVKLEETIGKKLRCILQRKHIADVFDIVFPVENEVEVSIQEVATVFFKVTVFGFSPSIAKGLFIDLPIDDSKEHWDKYIICAEESKIDFSQAKTQLSDFINTIIPDEPEHDFSRTFFPSNTRKYILKAGQSMTLLRICYKGKERLIEPYSLKFKVTKDGRAREYFYAWKVSGASSPPGIRCFLPANLTSIENTDIKFEPRFEVELRKAGGSEMYGRFSNRLASSRVSSSRRSGSGRNDRKYKFQCSRCDKVFLRKKNNPKMRKHKDKDGYPCHGRRGYRV